MRNENGNGTIELNLGDLTFYGQDAVEVQSVISMSTNEIMEYASIIADKANEEDSYRTPHRGTRKPTDRATRRKQTAHAKQKLTETKRVREMRSIPYSAFCKNAKGKSHPERAWDWLNLPPVQERRRTEKVNAEIALYLAE